MSTSNQVPSPQRRNPIVWLLGIAVAALLALVILLLVSGRGYRTEGGGGVGGGADGPKPGGVRQGQTVEGGPSKPPPRIPPDRITTVAHVGKTYEMVLKGNIEANASDSSWGTTVETFMQYVFECAIDRKIESNDGNTIVEVRHFKTLRNMKMNAKVEGVKWDFGIPGQVILGCLDTYLPGSSGYLETVQPYAARFVQGQYQQRLDEYVKAKGAVDSLSGKTVRLTFENGKGVRRIEAVEGSLTADEHDFIFATAVLSDYFVMPNREIKQGSSWAVDGQNLSGLIDPSLRGDTSGSVTVTRTADTTVGSHAAAFLQITDGRIVIDSTTPEKYDIGTFIPRGKLVFDLEDGFVASADLSGNVTIENCSRDHILYETSFRSKPVITVTYRCSMH